MSQPFVASRPFVDRWLLPVVDLLVPTACAGCGAAGASPCPACAAVLARGRPAPVPPVAEALDLPVLAALPYAAPVPGLLVGFKERDRRGLLTPLAAALADVVAVVLEHADRVDEHVVLVPVPSSRAAVRSRGRDTTAELAAAAARRLDRPGARCVCGTWVRHTRRVRDQAGLRAMERRRNLSDALVARTSHGTHRPVVVVDDIVTTGASLAETVRALRAAGHPVVGAATIAAADG